MFVSGDDEEDGDDDAAESSRPSIWKMSNEEFEKMLNRVLADDSKSLKLNCVSQAYIEFFPDNFTQEYSRNMNERSILRWKPGDGAHLELRDPGQDGNDKLLSPIRGSFLLHPGGVIPAVKVCFLRGCARACDSGVF